MSGNHRVSVFTEWHAWIWYLKIIAAQRFTNLFILFSWTSWLKDGSQIITGTWPSLAYVVYAMHKCAPLLGCKANNLGYPGPTCSSITRAVVTYSSTTKGLISVVYTSLLQCRNTMNYSPHPGKFLKGRKLASLILPFLQEFIIYIKIWTLTFTDSHTVSVATSISHYT